MSKKNIIDQLNQLKKGKKSIHELDPLDTVLAPQAESQVTSESYCIPDSSEPSTFKSSLGINQDVSLFDADEIFSLPTKQADAKEKPSKNVSSLKSYKEEFEKNPQLKNYKITVCGEITYNGNRVCNFLPSLEAVYVDEANPTQRLVDVAVIVNDRKTPVIQRVASNKIWKKNWFELNFSEAIIYTELPNATRHLLIVVRTLIAARTAQNIYVVKSLGWHKWRSKPFYACGDQILGADDSDIKLQANLNAQRLVIDNKLTLRQVGEGVINLCRIAPNVSRFLLTYMVLGLTKQLFVEAGANPRFCLFVSGESGSFKTTLSVFLSAIFNRDQPLAPNAQFTSTAAHLEKLLNVFKDNIVVIDDLHPSSSAKARNAMDAKLELMLRIVGDDKCKGRNSTAILGDDTSNPKALAILTGEFFSTEFSSAARCFHLAMNRKDVNLEILSNCQKEPLLLSTFAYYFLSWVSMHYEHLVTAIRQQHTKHREAKGHFTHARFKDMHDVFLIAHALFLDFLSETTVLNQNMHEQLFDQFSILLNEQIVTQAQALKNNDPVKLFFSCVGELIASGKITIVKRESRNDSKVYGYYDKTNVYLFKDTIYGAVERFLSEQKRRFPIPLNSLVDILRNRNLIECDADNRLSKVQINATFRPRMLVIDRKDFNKLCEK